jgi:hypothetical protein
MPDRMNVDEDLELYIVALISPAKIPSSGSTAVFAMKFCFPYLNVFHFGKPDCVSIYCCRLFQKKTPFFRFFCRDNIGHKPWGMENFIQPKFFHRPIDSFGKDINRSIAENLRTSISMCDEFSTGYNWGILQKKAAVMAA